VFFIDSDYFMKNGERTPLSSVRNPFIDAGLLGAEAGWNSGKRQDNNYYKIDN